jgi:hypothetical protein
MFETVSASIVLILCLVFLVRLMIGARRRYTLDAWARRTALGTKQTVLGLVRRRGSRKSAERLAEEAIRRARGEDEGHWEGNVYKPKSFKRPPRDKMH